MRVIYVNILMVQQQQQQNSPESATRITTNSGVIQVTSHPIKNSVCRPVLYDWLYDVYAVI
jgi:hypothetical protein